MTDSGLFAYLAWRFGPAPDVVATEALGYILTSSAAARAGLLNACAIATPGIPTQLEIGHRSDDAGGAGAGLVGTDPNGSVRLVLRPTFWGSLAEHEPADDLRSLFADRTSAVVIVAPATRFTTLWASVRRRCRLAGLPVHGDHAAGDPIRWTRVGSVQTLMLLSWSALLAGMRSSVAAAGDESLASEIDQLASLCARLDSETFQPLGVDEFAVVTPRRLHQLLDLLDEVATACERRGIGHLADRDAQASRGVYSRSLRVGHMEFALAWSVPHWSTLRETPFWLQIIANGGTAATLVEERLRPLSHEIPPRLLRDQARGYPLVPLFPLIGAEREVVVADLVGQVEEVARLLDEAPTIGFGSASGPST
jgi:hypothetical protein